MTWNFWIDRGGTFTDIVARNPQGTLSSHKYLSGPDVEVAGIIDIVGGEIRPGLIGSVKMGTTIATNALLERRGARVLLVVNKGFADALVIGNQTRPDLFAMHIVRPPMLYESVLEVDCRIAADGSTVCALDRACALAAMKEARARGLDSCAIALMHAWAYPADEIRMGELAREAGFAWVSLSHEVSPAMRLIPRAQTCVVDAYVSPVLRNAVQGIEAQLGGAALYFMQSHGGLTKAAVFRGKDAILSGPAGGIVAAARTAEQAGFSQVIGFDMGGTSTDVALYDGAFARVAEAEFGGIAVRAPMLDIHTVAAGGGSVLRFEAGRFQAGPHSAGADPGPAAYRRDGPLTVTDANICLGKIQPAYFPAIFGKEGTAPLDAALVQQQFNDLAARISDEVAVVMQAREVAEGFVRVAVANMANAIKKVTVQRGRDPRDFVLQCFGGAGGQHACLVAAELGISTVMVHPFAGVLSAYGMGLADQSLLRECAVERVFHPELIATLQDIADGLARDGRAALVAQGAAAVDLRVVPHVKLRYSGSDNAIDVALSDYAAMVIAFEGAQFARFGFVYAGREVLAESVFVEVLAAGVRVADISPSPHPLPSEVGREGFSDVVEIWSLGRAWPARVYDRDALRAGDVLAGPALVRERIATTVIEPGWRGEVTERGDLILKHNSLGEMLPTPALPSGGRETNCADPILLEIFNNLFMAVAEQAGVVLRNLASSVNIRERLDFSCAIFDAGGALIANAPHVPVHLGAMGQSVRAVLRARGSALRPGDVVALNNPANGGTHLPDITVITPIFDEAGAELRCFAACRGHHADVGGMTPGSTPPMSRCLADEGVVIDNFLIVRDGVFAETEFRALLVGAQYPARNPDMNVADIQAQIASNMAAASELSRVIRQYGWTMVSSYMGFVQANAADAVRRLIPQLRDGQFSACLDDGSKLCVSVGVDRAAGGLTIDFAGTGPQRADNFNAPRAVTRAVVMYVLRCLAGPGIPLNDGFMEPMTLFIPEGSFLAPSPGAAVVAGNTEISQAVCNALLGALGAQAASQGTMNNFLFGTKEFQYYETICGGSGAGPGFGGAHGVHTHMTNTRMTDPEVLEARYPMRVEEFSIRRGSGGKGQFSGGDGVVRRLRVLQPASAVLVSSSRVVAPFGLAGGQDGATGRQFVERATGEIESLSGVCGVEMGAGDVFVIETPGGGGFGT